MRVSRANGYILILTTLALLGGCASGSSQIAPLPSGQGSGAGTQPFQQQGVQAGRLRGIFNPLESMTSQHLSTTRSFMDPNEVGKPLVFVADDLHNNVDIFLQAKSHKMVGQVSLSPDSISTIATDIKGNLYVPVYNPNSKQETVNVYAPPYTNQPKLILQAGLSVLSIAVSRQGIVAAIICTGVCYPKHTEISFYAPGSTTPCATVPENLPKFTDASALSFDAQGDLYALGGYNNGSRFVSTVGKLHGGCSAKKINVLSFPNVPPGCCYDMHIDKAGRIAILFNDFIGSSVTKTIYTYKAKRHTLGSPVSTTPLVTQTSYSAAFAFVASGRALYSDETGSGSAGIVVNNFDYPAGGAPISTINVDPTAFSYGIAVTPPLP